MILEITKEEQALLLEILPKIQAPAMSKEVDIIRALYLKIRDCKSEQADLTVTGEVELEGKA